MTKQPTSTRVKPTPYKPIHYELRIEPNLDYCTYEGAVTIEIDILKTTSSITLNTHKLLIRNSKLCGGDGSPIALLDTRGDDERQTYTLLLEEPLSIYSRVFLNLTFFGLLNQNGVGFHIADGTAHTARTASTMMEPMHARSVFPCFDEPRFRADFSLTLIVHDRWTCLSNTPIKSTSEPSPRAKKIVEFERTPPIPTYLVAFVIGEFNMIESNDYRVPIRVYAPRNYNSENCRYVLDMATKMMVFHEKTFDFDCRLAKLDLVAVPGAVNGMENWGLITMSTCDLMIEGDSSAEQKMTSAQLIAHELAHQWIGNLVTIESWDNCWLKEGLAEWAGSNAREAIMGMDPWQDFVADDLQRGLRFDSSKSSHALELPFDSNSRTGFDDITYRKGCAIIRMIAHQFGQETFIHGLRRFVRLYAFDNARTEDFWEALSQSSRVDVAAMMKIWVRKASYPLISIEEDELLGTITLTQNKFSSSDSTVEVKKRLYPLFLNISTVGGIIYELMDGQSKTIKLQHEQYKINANQIGFFRVVYPASRLKLLGNDMGKEMMSVEDRVGLISDTAAVVFAGNSDVKTSDLLSLLQKFEDETNFFVWKAITATLREISRNLLFEEKGVRTAFDAFRKQLIKRCLYDKGRLTAKDDLNEQRFKALLMGSSAGDEKTLEAALIMFEKFIEGDKNAINPNIRRQVFEIVLTNGGKKEYKQLAGKIETASDAVKKDILASLGYARKYFCIKSTLKRATCPQSVKKDEMLLTLRGLTSHKRGIFILWRFLSKGEWTKVPSLAFERIAPVGEMLLDSLTSREHSEGARKYLRTVDTGTFETEMEMCFEGIEARARWLERDKADLIEWLTRKGYYQVPTSMIERSVRGIKEAVGNLILK